MQLITFVQKKIIQSFEEKFNVDLKMVVSDNPEYEHFKHVSSIQNWIKTQPHLPQNIRKIHFWIYAMIFSELFYVQSRTSIFSYFEQGTFLLKKSVSHWFDRHDKHLNI